MKIKTDYAKNLNFQIFSVKNKVRVSVITSNKYDWTSVKYLNVLHHNGTQKQFTILFLHIAKILPISYFGYSEQVWAPPSKPIMSTYLHAKNELHS